MVLFPEVDQGDTNWEMRESQHFYVYCRPSSEAFKRIEFITEYLDYQFEDCVEILQIRYENKLKCYIYNSVEELQKKQQTKAGGFAVPEFETICYYYPKMNWYGEWDGFKHEIVHVLVHWTVGIRKLYFLNEGISVAVEKYWWPAGWDKWQVHAVASGLLKNDRLFSIDQISNNEFFENMLDLEENKQDTTHHLYDQCGSLVRYLTDEYGMERFKTFYAKADQNNYRKIFQWIYGKEIDYFEKEWQEFLRTY